MEKSITVEVVVQASKDIVWEAWTNPRSIEQWNQADVSWHCPKAENDVRVGGRFIVTMAAKDGSASFDFSGTYMQVVPGEKLAYTMDDNRTAEVVFLAKSDTITKIVETFEPETQNSIELQRSGWQSILNSFKSYTEGPK
jgi:uncharacterized protein YndB with AHSA1/START domain